LPTVEPGKPYAFSFWFNAGGTAAATTTASITFYNASGNSISTTSASSTVGAVVSTTSWYRNSVTGTAPASAVYAQPSFAVYPNYFVDAMQFESYITSNAASLTSNVVTILTNVAHGFTTTNNVTVVGYGSPIDGTFPIASIPTTTSFTYAVTASNITAINTTGYVASASTFQDARTTTVNILANRRNLITNPTFTTATTGWSVSTSAVTITSTNAQSIYGTTSLKVDSPVSAVTYIYNTNRIAVVPSNDYTASAHVKWGSGAGVIYTIEIDWFVASSGGSAISTASMSSYFNAAGTQVTATTAAVSTATGWNRLFVSGRSPSNANFAEVRIIRTDAAGNTGTVYVDAVMFEKLSVLKPYFDGSFDGQSYADDRDSLWEGTADASVSHLYYNRVFNSGKIDSMITDGMFYA